MSDDAAVHAKTAGGRSDRKGAEELARYGAEDLNDDWEFKILRSRSGAFGQQDVVERVCEEESHAGWRMVEKCDNHRLRFKRPANMEVDDLLCPVDPYRTVYRVNSPNLGKLTVAVTTGIVLGGSLTMLAIAN